MGEGDETRVDEPRAPSGAREDGASPRASLQDGRVSLEMRPRVSFQGDVGVSYERGTPSPRRSLEVMRHSQEVLRRVGEETRVYPDETRDETRVYPNTSAVDEPVVRSRVSLEMRPRVSFHGVTGLVGFAPE